jgi:selenium-binding protein 1
MSPYLPKITGQEDLSTPDARRRGHGRRLDKLVTIGATPGSPTYGKVVSSTSVGGRHEGAHHAGFSDDGAYLGAGGLDDSKIWVFDVATDPAQPKLSTHHRQLS